MSQWRTSRVGLEPEFHRVDLTSFRVQHLTMSCEKDKHEWRAVNPFVHPTELDGKGEPLKIIGAPPQSEEEAAWCCTCGALRSEAPFGMGWGIRHHTSDKEAPTLGNMLGGSEGAKRMQAYSAMASAVQAARAFTPMSQEAEAEIAELQSELWKKMTKFQQMAVEVQVKSIQGAWGAH